MEENKGRRDLNCAQSDGGKETRRRKPTKARGRNTGEMEKKRRTGEKKHY